MEEKDILIFKTNIFRESDLHRIRPVLLNESRIKKWHVDTTDIDHVLRIEAHDLEPTEVINLVTHTGFYCEELAD